MWASGAALACPADAGRKNARAGTPVAAAARFPGRKSPADGLCWTVLTGTARIRKAHC